MSQLIPSKGNSNATIVSFTAHEMAERTLMRSTILSVAPHRKNKHKPAPRSAWLSSKPQPSSTIPLSAPIGSAATPPTASITAPLPLPVTTPLSAASSSPPSTPDSSHRRHRYASFMHRPYMGDNISVAIDHIWAINIIHPFVLCASRQARVSLSSFPRDLIPRFLRITHSCRSFYSISVAFLQKSTPFLLIYAKLFAYMDFFL